MRNVLVPPIASHAPAHSCNSLQALALALLWTFVTPKRPSFSYVYLTLLKGRRNLRAAHTCGHPQPERGLHGVGFSEDGQSAHVRRREECNVISRLCRIVFVSALLVAVGGTMSSVQAQGLTGQISGTVTDSGGGVLPGATVVLKNAGTNATRETVTGADGAFLFPDLLAGKYDITVKRQRLQDLRTEGHQPRVDRARGAARHLARSRRRGRNRHGAGRGRHRADDDGCAVGD